MKVFFDTEFTGLTKSTELLSIGFVTEINETFYAELVCNKTDFRSNIKETVLKNANTVLKETKEEVVVRLSHWLSQFGSESNKIEMWSDVLAFDWVLFCDLFGHAYDIPKSVYYIPFDLATLFLIKGTDPDISREEFSGIKKEKHNALNDALMLKKCYEKLMEA